ncbi:MAG: hypothetical protein AAGD12_13735 [Pseudomonadota bacterium]
MLDCDGLCAARRAGASPVDPARPMTQTAQNPSSGAPAARALKQHVSALSSGVAQTPPDITAGIEAATRILAAEAALLDRVLPLIGPVPIGDVRRILAQARLCLCEQCETELPGLAAPTGPCAFICLATSIGVSPETS